MIQATYRIALRLARRAFAKFAYLADLYVF